MPEPLEKTFPKSIQAWGHILIHDEDNSLHLFTRWNIGKETVVLTWDWSKNDSTDQIIGHSYCLP